MYIPASIVEQISTYTEESPQFLTALEDPASISISDSNRNSYKLVSMVAYLLGVPAQYFSLQDDRISKKVFDSLEESTAARIVRELCIVRTAMLRHFKEYNDAIHREHRTLATLLPERSVLYLSQNRLSVADGRKNLVENILMTNMQIRDRINNCQKFFPSWIQWDYLRDIFIMPAKTVAAEKAEAEKYFQNRMAYPFQMYMNWDPSSEGNILSNDYRFMTLLYQWHNDYLDHSNLVSDIGSYTKERIYDFVQDSKRTVIIVDCENSDPYKFLSALNSLEQLSDANVTRIILYDDVNAATGWRLLKHHTSIPIEYHLIERIKAEKSLADIRITAKICEEYYKNDVDSFILVSSDSDFWGVMTELPDARFLVLLEYLKDSNAIKEALDSKSFFHCYLDKFYSDNEDLVRQALHVNMTSYLREHQCMNLYEAIDEAQKHARIRLSDCERKELFKQLSKRLQLVVDTDGAIRIEIRR